MLLAAARGERVEVCDLLDNARDGRIDEETRNGRGLRGADEPERCYGFDEDCHPSCRPDWLPLPQGEVPPRTTWRPVGGPVAVRAVAARTASPRSGKVQTLVVPAVPLPHRQEPNGVAVVSAAVPGVAAAEVMPAVVALPHRPGLGADPAGSVEAA